MKNGILFFLVAFIFISFFFLAIPEKGYSGFATVPTGCCIGPNGDCVNFGEGAIACQIGSVVEDGMCSMEGPEGICAEIMPPESRPIPTLSEWGLIAMAGVLGIVGLLVIRRRKVTA